MQNTCYCGYIANPIDLKKSSSGGLATALAIQVIGKNGLVYGVEYSHNFREAHYARVDEINRLKYLQGSKYIKAKIKSDNLDTFSSVASDLSLGNYVLFIGLPCVVAALKKILIKKGYNTEKLLLVDLICQGPTYPEVAKQFLDNIEKRYNSKVIDFSVRYKNPNWRPPYLRAVFENGKVYSKPFYNTDYGIAFKLYGYPSCYECKFKGENHVSDITIGDYWGINDNDECYNSKGVSVAFVHTNKGKEVLLSLSNFLLFIGDEKKAILHNQVYVRSRKKHIETERFINIFNEKGLHAAARSSINLKNRISITLPKNILSFLKRIFRTFNIFI